MSLAFDMSIPAPYYVESEYEARQWINYFLQSHKVSGSLGLDSETTGVVKHKDSVLLWSLSDGAARICLPRKMLELFKEPILENPEINFDFSNAKFDAHMFGNSGIDLRNAGQWRDTVVQSFYYNENNLGRHGLKECIKDHFGRQAWTFEQTFGAFPKAKKGQPKPTSGELILKAMETIETRVKASDYASMDAYNTIILRQYFDQRLAERQMYDGMTLKDYYYRVAVPFTRVLFNMERRGFQIDAGYLWELKGPMEQELLRIEKEFARSAGRVVNLRSPQQLRELFFNTLGKEPLKYTKGGSSGIQAPSTDVEVLEEWAGQGDPHAKLLLEYRGIDKIYGTYVTSLMELVDSEYRIHTTLNQTGAQSGRLSSSEPNLQNIPRPDEDKFRIRDAFIAGEGKTLIVADYAQLEMRLMAHFSGDQKMIHAIRNDIDLHCFTVSEMNGIPYDEVIAAVHAKEMAKKGGPKLTPRQKELLVMRQAAKATGFGIIYGIGGARLANQLTKQGDRILDEAEGYRLIDKWFSVFPDVRVFIEQKKKQLWNAGYVQTLTGRFRQFGDLSVMEKKQRSACERTGVNAIIQGSAADIAQQSMILAEHDPLLRSLGAELLLQVHDELVFECPDDPQIVTQVKARVSDIMSHPFSQDLLVPLPAEAGSGFSWATAK